MTPAVTQLSWASLIDVVSSACCEGSPSFGPSSETGSTIFVAFGFHLWSDDVGGFPGTLPIESFQDKHAQFEPGPQSSPEYPE